MLGDFDSRASRQESFHFEVTASAKAQGANQHGAQMPKN
jgi:hypothetical protein